MIILNPDHTHLDKKKFYVWAATWFGCGLMNKAPGTWGSLGALPPGLFLLYTGGTTALCAGIVIVTILGFWSAKQFSAATQAEDSKMIVIDEVVGMWIALLVTNLNPLLILVAFAAFRFFDVLKPWPVSLFDRMKGETGIMLDDIAAGWYAVLIVYGAQLVGLG